MESIVNRLRGLSDVAPTFLDTQNITTDSQVWRFLGDGKNNQLNQLVNGLRATTTRQVLDVLYDATIPGCERLNQGRSLSGTAIVLGGLVILGGLSVLVYGLSHLKADQVVVVKKEGLAPLHIIHSGDVEIQHSIFKPKSLSKMMDAVGRYTLIHVAKDSVLTEDVLSSSPLPASASSPFTVVQISAAAGQTLPPAKYPAKITLYFYPKDKPEVRLTDVILLNASTVGDKTTLLVIQPASANELPNSEAYIGWPAP